MMLATGLAAAAGFCLGLAALRQWRSWRLPHSLPASPKGLAPVLRLAWPLLWRLALGLEKRLSWRHRDRLHTLMLQAGLPAAMPRAWLPACSVLCAALAALAAASAALLTGLSLAQTLALMVGTAGVAAFLPFMQMRGHLARGRLRVAADLPFLLDVMTLCVESGQSLANAMQLAAVHCPPGGLTRALQLALNEMRTGRQQREALAAMAARLDVPGVHAWVAALQQADRLGGSVGAVMRGLARQLRDEAFQRAETQAMQAPVKMLFPLVICMFPCTFIILAFPLLADYLPLAGS